MDSEDTKELQVFEVKFKDGKITTKYYAKIQSAIPYPMLFLYGKNKFAIVINGKLLTTEKDLLTMIIERTEQNTRRQYKKEDYKRLEDFYNNKVQQMIVQQEKR